MRDTYLKNVVPVLKRFSDYLGEKTWFAGENVSSYSGVSLQGTN